MKNTNITLFIGGTNLDYVKKGVKIFIKYKKNVKLLVFTNSCSDEIYQYAINRLKNKKIIISNKPHLLKKNLNLIKQYSDIGFNLGFNFIISKLILKITNIVNPHPSYLPYNKGSHHSFWSIIDK